MKSKWIKLAIIMGAVVILSSVTGYADVFDSAKQLAKDASKTVITLSTPAALIGVGTGAFMKKFSMGDHQKVAMGNKVFWSSITGWATINGLTMILDTVSNYIR